MSTMYSNHFGLYQSRNLFGDRAAILNSSNRQIEHPPLVSHNRRIVETSHTRGRISLLKYWLGYLRKLHDYAVEMNINTPDPTVSALLTFLSLV